ncbi:GntR family transcriptional regulator [Tepidamorphus gemmatus]|uniref:GntR family transcriptional regulator n=1 Tax=Tepidamorphus gemmatus TaxID=747076 RepID=A0A4R3M8L0_9HYPH|nr:UTRA domain-containing protein [Tepidamorphus gemmatus]TCT09864.1 GntR family transcriptional regulator [Tepidamorphus gemmatus]
MSPRERPPVLDGSGAVYQQIRRALARPIISGEWRPGVRIPSETELAGMFGASRMTVNKALTSLAEEGLIRRRRRHGSFVADRVPERSVLEIWDVGAEVARAGQTYLFDEISRRVGPADAGDADRLGVDPGAAIVEIVGVHRADGDPVQLERRLINLAAAPGAERCDFRQTAPGRWLLDTVAWTDAEHLIRAVNADAGTARLLAIGVRDACLLVERRTWNGRTPITWVELVNPGSARRLVGRFSPAGG